MVNILFHPSNCASFFEMLEFKNYVQKIDKDLNFIFFTDLNTKIGVKKRLKNTKCKIVTETDLYIDESLIQKILSTLPFLKNLSLSKELFDLIKSIRIAKHLLSTTKPDIILLSSDRMVGVETALVKESQYLKIPSLILPTAISTPSASINYRHRKSDFTQKYVINGFIKKALRVLFPKWTTEFRNHTVLFYPLTKSIAAQILKIMPSNPWALGGGNASLMAVMSQMAKDMFLSQSIDRNKLVITGKASSDRLFQNARNAESNRKKFIFEHKIPSKNKIILCSIPQLAEHQLLSWDDHWQEIRFLFSTLSNVNNSELVLTLHPRSRFENYSKLAAENNALLINNHDVNDLLPICDIFVCCYSTCATLAIGLLKPTVNIDFYGFDYPFYEKLSGLIHLKDKEKLAPTLDRLVSDQNEYTKYVKASRSSRDFWVCSDGKNNYRIAREMKRLISNSHLN